MGLTRGPGCHRAVLLFVALWLNGCARLGTFEVAYDPNATNPTGVRNSETSVTVRAFEDRRAPRARVDN